MTEGKPHGVLYVVATPIGNLEDITQRALRILREVNLVACEDTRQTRKLLDHYQITTPTVSYHEHNEAARAGELVRKLEDGVTIAQVSDAGMPGISDPGYRVIKLAIESGITVTPIPGPSALIAALVGSGLATDAFDFRGFLPAKQGQRRTALEAFARSSQTVVVYEAPHRIRETVEDIVAALGPGRQIVIARELTKIHEEFLRGTAVEVLAQIESRELKGEITLLIGAGEATVQASQLPDLSVRLQEIMRTQKLDEKSALKVLAKQSGLAKSEVYREVQRRKGKKR